MIFNDILTLESHSEMIADFTGSIVNRLLNALIPPVWPNAYLLVSSKIDMESTETDSACRDYLFYELSCETSHQHNARHLSPFENINRITRIVSQKSTSGITVERIEETLRRHLDEQQIHKSGYELFVSRKCDLHDTSFFLILVVPLGSEGFDSSELEKPVNNAMYEGIVNVIAEKIDDCPVFKPNFTRGNLQDDLNRANVWFCNPFEIENLMRESLAYVLGRTFFYYYPEIEQKIGLENLTAVGKMIFSMLHSISITHVEKKGCIGHLIFVNRENAQVHIPLQNIGKDYRLTRKLLSLSSKHNSLLCDHDGPFGLGQPKPGSEPIFTVAFTSYGNWEIQREGKTLACVQSGNVSFHRGFIATSIHKQVRRLFEQTFDMNEVNLIVSIINRVVAREKGTILVFHRNAKSEAERLQNRGCLTNVKIERNNLALVDDMIAIDGALLFDLDCTCHAIGMILDGKVRDGMQDDRNRGARYNSACTYVDSTEGEAIAVVISEDGGIDFFPREHAMKAVARQS